MILLLGKSGFLGSNVSRWFCDARETHNWGRASVNEFLGADAITKIEMLARYHLIINCIGDTRSVNSSDVDLDINIKLVYDLAAFKSNSTRLIHFSSDYFANGAPQVFSENALPKLGSLYGVSKYISEYSCLYNNVVVLRGSFLGASARGGIINMLLSNETALKGWVNFTSSSINVVTLVKSVLPIVALELEETGVFNYGTTSGYAKYELLKDLNNRHRLNKKIDPICVDFGSVERSLNCTLNVDRLKKLGVELPNYEDNLVSFDDLFV